MNPFILPRHLKKFSGTALLLVLSFTLALGGSQEATNPELDPYGGTLAIKGQATGWFHLEKLRDRWFFVTPDGHAYIPIGVNHLMSYLNSGSTKLRPTEHDFVKERHGGDVRQAAAYVEKTLRTWGFNFAGYDSPPFFRQSMPFSIGFNQTEASGVLASGKPRYEDVFAPAFAANLDQRVAKFCQPLRDNRYLLGYYLADLPLWGDLAYLETQEQKQGESWLSFFRKLPSDSPGKLAYEKATQDAPDRNAAELAFLAEIADQSYRLTAEAFHRHDPHHLVLGERFAGERLFLPVVERSAKYFPVVALQIDGEFNPAFYNDIHQRTGRPLINADHVGNFPTAATPGVMGRPLENEAAAAAQYSRYLQSAFAQPYMVGYSRCQLATRIRPLAGPTSWKQGIIDPSGTAYPLLLQAITTTNHAVLQDLYQR